jgi:hypothetical protein
MQSVCADRQRAYDEANAVLAQVREESRKVQVWAELAEGSPSSASALAKLKEARSAEKFKEQGARNAQKQLEAAQADLAKREPALSKLIADNQALVGDLDRKAPALQAVRAQAHETLGRETLQHVSTQLCVLKGQVDKQKRGLIECQLDFNAACEAARATLSPWPELLQQAMEEYSVYEDASTRILAAYLAFLDVLSTEGPDAKTLIVGYSLPGQIELSAEFLDAVMRRGYEVGKQIADRRAGAQKLLQLYRENMKP